jgi:WD40 repeat protein
MTTILKEISGLGRDKDNPIFEISNIRKFSDGPLQNILIWNGKLFASVQCDIFRWNHKFECVKFLESDSFILGLGIWDDRLCVSCLNSQIRIYNSSGNCIQVFIEQTVNWKLCASKEFLYGICHAVINVWNRNGTKELLEGHVNIINSMCFWNGVLCSGSADETIIVWKYKENQNSLLKAGSCVYCIIAWNGYLCSSLLNGEIKIWEYGTWKCIQKLKGHTNIVKSMILYHEMLISYSEDKTLKIWNNSLQCVKTSQSNANLNLCVWNDNLIINNISNIEICKGNKCFISFIQLFCSFQKL